MKQRIITGLIGGAGFLFLVWLGDIPYSVLIVLLAVLAFYEYLKMNRTNPASIEGLLGFAAIILIISSQNKIINIFDNIETLETLLILIPIYLTIIVLKKNKVNFDDIGYILLGTIYIGFGFSYMLATRLMENGFSLTLLVLLTTWASDSGAYFTGKYLGKHKLWPAISPNKTIEGATGAIIFAILVSLLTNYFANITESTLTIILIGIIISVAGQMGDLAESALKRSKEIKDSGAILPGHGGVLDRFDSLIFVFPILHLLSIL